MRQGKRRDTMVDEILVIDSNSNVLDFMFNNNLYSGRKGLTTFDFSTLYTSIPHFQLPWCLHIETRFHYAAEGARDVLYKMLTIEERVRSKLEIRSYVCACTLSFGV